MRQYQDLSMLPMEIQRDWRAELHKAVPTERGVIRLVDVRRTEPGGYEEGRIGVLVVDESGFPIPGVKVAFSFSTAKHYTLEDTWLWVPPSPRRAFIGITSGAGQTDMILGAEGVVKAGEAGGVTVYCLEPIYSCDCVTGLGMLANHEALSLTFQLQRRGHVGLDLQMTRIEARLDKLEAAVG